MQHRSRHHGNQQEDDRHPARETSARAARRSERPAQRAGEAGQRHPAGPDETDRNPLAAGAPAREAVDLEDDMANAQQTPSALERVAETLTTVTAAIDAAEAALNMNAVEAELAAWMTAHQERYQELPAASAVSLKRRQLQERATTAAAVSLTPVDHAYRAALPLVEEAEHEAQQPPDLVAALTHGGGSHSRSDYIAALTADELMLSRLRHELPGLSPLQVRAAYEKALASPADLRANATVRAVEEGLAFGWLGVGAGTPELAAQWQRLADTVTEIRRSRIPDSVRRLRGAVEYARALALHGHKDKGLPYWTEAPKESK
jgi:hypothetical protein